MNHSTEVEEDDFVEDENKGDGETIKPWDPGKIRITTKNFSIREVLDRRTAFESLGGFALA
jgi:hypothetical protein